MPKEVTSTQYKLVDEIYMCYPRQISNNPIGEVRETKSHPLVSLDQWCLWCGTPWPALCPRMASGKQILDIYTGCPLLGWDANLVIWHTWERGLNGKLHASGFICWRRKESQVLAWVLKMVSGCGELKEIMSMLFGMAEYKITDFHHIRLLGDLGYKVVLVRSWYGAVAYSCGIDIYVHIFSGVGWLFWAWWR